MMLACSALNDGHISLFRCKGGEGDVSVSGMGVVHDFEETEEMR